MKKGMLVCLVLFTLCFLPFGAAYAGPNDFTADFYAANGINPDNITFLDSPGFGQEINTITGGFDNAGNVIFYTANTAIFEDSFTPDPAGAEAFETAEAFVAWLFPKKAGDPLSPAFPNRRQDNIFDTRGGYFANNPLGLWRLEFIQWRSDEEIIDAGFANRVDDCAALRAALLEANGPSLDGPDSPILRTSAQVREAKAKGCVSAMSRPMAPKATGPFRWVA